MVDYQYVLIVLYIFTWIAHDNYSSLWLQIEIREKINSFRETKLLFDESCNRGFFFFRQHYFLSPFTS